MGEHLKVVSSHFGRAGMRAGSAGEYVLERAWMMKQRLDREADPDENTGLAGNAVALQAYRDVKGIFGDESDNDPDNEDTSDSDQDDEESGREIGDRESGSREVERREEDPSSGPEDHEDDEEPDDGEDPDEDDESGDEQNPIDNTR